MKMCFFFLSRPENFVFLNALFSFSFVNLLLTSGLQLQADRTSVSSIFSNISSNAQRTVMKNDHQYSGRCFMTKAKMSVEGGVLEKDSVRVSDKIGNFLDS